jgi:nitrite reductase/ring-hydroxylating ferredoxin subunit
MIVAVLQPRDPQGREGLTCAARYGREIEAPLERVWENVYDWEHLPWLHASSFAWIHLEDRGAWGWRARVGLHGDREISLELRADRDAGCYVSATRQGAGAGSEIWTRLDALRTSRTRIGVEFWVPDLDPRRADRVGAGYVELYTRLWDEDEAMILRRTALLRNRPPRAPRPGSALSLGALANLRARLPLVASLDGHPYRVLEHEGSLLAHSALCPHRMGPLDQPALDADGCLRCPWHGHRFDARTGRSADGHPLALAPAPRIEIDPATTHVRLLAPEPARPAEPDRTPLPLDARGRDTC